MILVSKRNGQTLALNAELIETIENSSPDTIITLTNGNRYMVRESVEEVMRKVVEYKKKLITPIA